MRVQPNILKMYKDRQPKLACVVGQTLILGGHRYYLMHF